MRIIGIDPGTRIVGWGVLDVEGSRLEPVASGVIRASAKEPLSARLRTIHDGISQVIEKTAPNVAAVEDIFHGPNTATLIKIGEARGVIILAAAAAGLPVESYTPAEVKKAVTGRGNATKDQVREMVQVILGVAVEGETLDETDALAVAICQSHRIL